jgi:hypothetical protein
MSWKYLLQAGWKHVIVMAGCLGALTLWLPSAHSSIRPELARVTTGTPTVHPTQTFTPFQPVIYTQTPFQPYNTPLPTPTFTPVPTETPLPTETPVLDPSFQYYGINFHANAQPVTIDIYPPDNKVNGGQPIHITFTPGEKCIFGDHRACVNGYRADLAGDLTFLTVHSGVGGEGQALRNALEGTWIDRAGLPLSQVMNQMDALRGARVIIRQGDHKVEDSSVARLGRVPALEVARYFRISHERGLTLAVNSDGDLGTFALANQPTLIIETCGWKMAEEPWADGVSWTTGAVYLTVIH